ncbi:MAG TPA: DinB family protein [Candidatus Methylomirabilis sp.]|nr:DinB family protein [Candidatus Methylomirabilis sp.]
MTTSQAMLRQQLAGSHDILEQTIADCSQEVLDKNLPGATINSVGSIYAHTIFSEDGILHGMLQGKPPIYKTQGWAARTNVQMPEQPEFSPEWARAVRMKLPAFREYAKAVYAATDAYLAGLSDADLERKVQTGFVGEQTVAFVIGNVLAWHAAQHTGEIAALKGVQGLKGLPF